MSVPYRQRRLLRRIDHSLRRSDPDLQSMLRIFARLNAGEDMPAWEQLPRAETGSWSSAWPVDPAPYTGLFFFLSRPASRQRRRSPSAACVSALSGSPRTRPMRHTAMAAPMRSPKT
jgi:hypothetical protein